MNSVVAVASLCVVHCHRIAYKRPDRSRCPRQPPTTLSFLRPLPIPKILSFH